MKKIVQENRRTARKVKVISIKGFMKLRSSTSMKVQAIKEKMRLVDSMAEASNMKQKKLRELASEELKIKMKIERAKARFKIMEAEE